ncbi:tetratricopeptide repeat protein [Actinomadura sp. KC345]|nr:tetratricopeptide repeat protein [Actinomadura sp. KC345]
MPVVPALSGALPLSRALRPLRATVPSLTRRLLDESATAQRIAETGVCEPVMVPAHERRHDLALIADVGPSMVVWRQTVEELRLLLQHLGAFRDLTTWYLDSGAHRLSLRTGSAFGVGAERDPDELVDPTHRRLILVVSDCIGAAWRDGRAASLLDRWGRAGTVAIAQPLPQRLWWRTGAAIEPVRFGASGPGVVNEQLTVVRPAPQLPGDRPEGEGIPIPVVELSERWLRSWAEMVARGGQDIMGAALFTGRPAAHPPAIETGPGDVSPEMRVKQFRASSSPAAFKLATYLAAAPLRLPIMRLVQRAMLPTSTSADLAEVFLSGMLRMVGRPADGGEEEIVYEFHDGVREILLQGLRRREVHQVLRAVWSVVRDRIGSSLDFPALLAAVSRGEAQLPPDLPFAQVAVQALAGLGGPYREMARRLTSEAAADPDEDGVDATLTTSVTTTGPPAGPEPVPVPRSALPPRNQDFIGRDRLLAAVRAALREGMAALLPSGMGGEGKSNLAVEYAYRHADDYDLVWWIPAEQTTSARASLASLARRLGMPMSDDIKETVDGVLRALRTVRPYARWLLIYDNAQDPEQIVPLTPLAVGGPGAGLRPGQHVLVTSRDRGWERHASVVDVDVFERQESIALLRRLAPRLSVAEADLLSERVGDLPLAVHQAAAWQAVTGGTVEDYLRLFELRLGDAATADPAGEDLPGTLAACVSMNLDLLQEQDPVAWGLLELWAVFDPEPVSCRLLAAGREAALPGDLAALLAGEARLRAAMETIARFSLARFDEESATLQVHRLVRTILNDRLGDDGRRRVQGLVHGILAAATPDEEPEVESTWERRSEITPHVVPSGVFDADGLDIRLVGIDQAKFLYQSGEYEGSRHLAEIAIDRWMRRYGPDDDAVLDISRVLANALRGLGDNRAAAALSEDNLTRTRRKFGIDHMQTLFAATGFGADLRFLGDFRRAYQIDLDAWLRMRQLHTDADPKTQVAAGNLALDRRILGEFQAAYDIDLEVWRRQAEPGQPYRQRFRTTHNLARDLHALGRYGSAYEMQAESLGNLRPVLGPGHAMVLQAKMSHAGTLRKLGRFQEAHRLAAETFTAYVRRFGERHPNTLASKVCLALTTNAAGRPAEALPLIDEALAAYRQEMGEEHPFVLVCAIDRAVVLRRLAEAYEAQETDQAALSKLEAGVLGPDHYYALCAKAGLANDYYLLGEMEAAVRLLSEAREKLAGSLGERHPYALAVTLNLERARAAMGGDRERGIESVLDSLRLVLGRDHPEVQAARRGEPLECDIEPTAL